MKHLEIVKWVSERCGEDMKDWIKLTGPADVKLESPRNIVGSKDSKLIVISIQK